MLGEAARAAPHFPRTQIVVNHAGCPRTAAKEACAPGARRWRGWRGWRAQPNVTIKISGIGEAGGRWRLEANRRVVLEVMSCSAWSAACSAATTRWTAASYQEIFEGFAACVSGFSADERGRQLVDNARRMYRIRD
jgi:predicted TIM-barrel fold metal-dependent hydrolase